MLLRPYLSAGELIDDIEQAYREELIDDSYVGLDEIESDIALATFRRKNPSCIF